MQGYSRYTPEIEGIVNNNRYHLASRLLEDLLNHNDVNHQLLQELYGVSSDAIALQMYNYFQNNEFPSQKRIYNDSAPIEIGEMSYRANLNTHNMIIHAYLANSQVPHLPYLEALYGDYAKDAQKLFDLFIKSDKKRECGIPITMHHQRVAATTMSLLSKEYVDTFGENYLEHISDEEKKELQKFSAIALWHDSIEDLIYSIRKENGEVKYGIKNYDKFLNDFIPKDLQEGVKLLTNHYDLIINYAKQHLEEKGQAFTRKNLKKFLERTYEKKPTNLFKPKFTSLREYIQDITDILDNVDDKSIDPFNMQEEFSDKLAWYCYEHKYIPKLVTKTHEMQDYRPLEIKLIDLSDNGQGIDAISMVRKVKNTLKRIFTVDKIHEVIGTIDWQPLQNHANELEADALLYARHLMLKDLIQTQSPQDHVASALVKLDLLKPVFYYT